jgi:hypothetical protein
LHCNFALIFAADKRKEILIFKKTIFFNNESTIHKIIYAVLNSRVASAMAEFGGSVAAFLDAAARRCQPCYGG